MAAILHQRHKYTSLKHVCFEDDTSISRLSDVLIQLFKKDMNLNYCHQSEVLKGGLFAHFPLGESRCDGMRYKCAKKHGLHS